MQCPSRMDLSKSRHSCSSNKTYTPPTFNHDELEPVKKSKAYRLKFDQCALEEVKPNHGLLDSDMI
jgi:hypothetical protein